jgi:hypothetical protein
MQEGESQRASLNSFLGETSAVMRASIEAA